MKFAVALLALVTLGSSAPQPRKLFHEHFEEFVDIITAEVGEELGNLGEQYYGFQEFRDTIEYILTTNFKDLIYEMEALPEFKAVVEFLENDNIDMLYFIDRFNEMLDFQERATRAEPSGFGLSDFITDSINLFPTEKLQALFEQKKAEDEEFRVAVENLQSEEWNQVFDALWNNEVFQKEVQTLSDNGIDVQVFLNEIKAIFGQ